MKKFVKGIIQIIFACIITFAYLFSPLTVQAKTANTIAELKENLASLKAQKAEQENKKDLTEGEISSNKNKISNSYKEKEMVANEVEEAKNKVDESQTEIERTSKDIDSILKYYQLTMDSQEFLEYITGASTTTEMIMRASAIEQISTYYKNKIVSLKDLIVENQNLQVELDEKSKELETKINEYSDALDTLNDQLDDINDVSVDINSQITAQQDLIKYYQSVCDSETQDLSTCTKDPQSYGWLKPLVRGRLTQNHTSIHHAVDIGGNPEGTAEYAAAAGKVAAVYHEKSCGGNIAYIHVTVNGVKYTLEYAHMLKVNVKVGQYVTTDTVVGTVGGYSTSIEHGGYDRCTGGMHLHFGVSTGWYLQDYYSWSQWVARNITPPGFPSLGVWWYKR